MIACFLIPAIVRGPRQARAINCDNNLKQVGLAFLSWAIDNGDNFPMSLSTNGVVTNDVASLSRRFNRPGPPSVVTNGPGTMELIASGNAFVHFRVLSNELSTPKVL